MWPMVRILIVILSCLNGGLALVSLGVLLRLVMDGRAADRARERSAP